MRCKLEICSIVFRFFLNLACSLDIIYSASYLFPIYCNTGYIMCIKCIIGSHPFIIISDGILLRSADKYYYVFILNCIVTSCFFFVSALIIAYAFLELLIINAKLPMYSHCSSNHFCLASLIPLFIFVLSILYSVEYYIDFF